MLPENFTPKADIRALQSVRFRFAVHSSLKANARRFCGQKVVTLDGTLSLHYGPHAFGRYDERGGPILNPKLAAGQAVEKTRGGKVQKPTFPPRLEIPQSARDCHFPTASAAARD
jgi:hypothetical protein